MEKKFTNREFNALASEVFSLAKTITNKTINSCSVSIDKDYINLIINGSETEKYKNKCIVFFHKDRYAKVAEFRTLYKVVSCIPNVSYGKYLSLISKAYMNCDSSKTFFDF